MESFIAWFLDNINYWTITLCMTIESSFIPFPSEVVVPPAAWLAAKGENSLNIYLIVAFATLGACFGAIINYYLAMWLGRPIVYKFANSRLGRFFLLSEAKIKKSEEYFEKNGAISTLIGRLIPAVRQLISIPAGLAKMRIGKFILYTTLGAGVWNIILTIIGVALSQVPGIEDKQALIEMVEEYSKPIGYGFLALAILIIVYMIYKGRRNKI
ncbi:MAG: DedA family protein [Bacteroidales bacterium]|nr:DedA family protein [Bacteroidales bacterium]